MISADITEDCILPVVHIRIVHDGDCLKHSCDFCRKSFQSADDLAQHVQVNREEATLCEYCGLNLTSKEYLVNHIQLKHYSGFAASLTCDLGIVELNLKDISSMGMGDPDCKTLFQVIEVSLTKDLVNSPASRTKVIKENVIKIDSLKKDKEGITNVLYKDTIQTPNTNISVISNCENQSPCPLTEKDPGIGIICGNSLNKTVSEKSMEDGYESQLEMIICCDTDEKSIVASSPGEIIVTVESEEELVWSKEVMSQVICSSGILKRTPGISDLEKEDPAPQSVTVQCVNNYCGRNYSHQSDFVNQGQEQAFPRKLNNESVKCKDDTLDITDNKLNFNKSAIMKTIHSDSPPKLASSSTGRSALAKSLQETLSVQSQLQRMKMCRICGMVFRNLGYQEQHENTFHGIRIKCELCDDSFVYSKSLRNHRLRKHSSTSAGFQCEDCDKIFKCRSNLWSHRLTHLSQEMRRFQCPQCPQRFAIKSKLNKHLQSHTGEKKFQCGECVPISITKTRNTLISALVMSYHWCSQDCEANTLPPILK
ncbi:Zinc finger protein 100-like 1 [Homarus americanus]|uniref:Zinc finger protein 100-like 1 n=1 Tax=Homarus americanus TaxID=6706 RepID=A0A8J5K801_HOMAM|nr:Zinc finger protein 100-like 1 [Homarus americanus]